MRRCWCRNAVAARSSSAFETLPRVAPSSGPSSPRCAAQPPPWLAQAEAAAQAAIAAVVRTTHYPLGFHDASVDEEEREEFGDWRIEQAEGGSGELLAQRMADLILGTEDAPPTTREYSQF